MGKLSESQQLRIGQHVITAELMPNKNNVRVVCDNAENGKSVKNFLAEAYPEYSYVATDSAWSGIFGGWITANVFESWSTFRVLCNDREKAAELLNVINECREKYLYAAMDHTDDNGGSGSGGGTSYVVNNYYPQEEESKENDWTTYVVIGAAAIVIILLLWDKKKK